MKRELIEKNEVLKLTFEFSILIIQFCEELETLRKYDLARQLFKSGTSIGANVKEAQNAESKADFIHKFKIAAKEADETEYWLMLCSEFKNFPETKLLFNKLDSINKIITKIISTSKNNNKTALANHHIS